MLERTNSSTPEFDLDAPHGSLEEYLLTLDNEESLLSYRELPSSLTSSITEQYANCLSSLAKLPSEYDELGAYIHLRRNPKNLIYPVRPNAGKGGITPAFSRNRARVVPVALVHNHPIDSCFSQPPGHDLECVVNGYEDKGSTIQVPVWMLSTPDDNFLLLRTQETKIEDPWKLYEVSYIPEDHEFLDLRRFGTELGEILSADIFWKVFDIAELISFGGKGYFDSFYKSFYGTYQIAEFCHLGFYHSSKNGDYNLITKEFLDGLIKTRYQQALEAALAYLSKMKL